MEMLDLLEKMMKFAGEKVGQKPGDQWRGSDKSPPGKKLVGDSILKDLGKGKTPKTKEQELSEEFQAFLEAEFKDTVDKRPGRKSDRPSRGHEPQPRYKTIKADEAVGQEYTVVIDRKGREKPVTGTMEELLGYFGYTLEVGKSYEHEKGRYKINLNPKNVEQLVDTLNKAASNAAANSAPSTYYSVGENQLAESHYKWEITFRDGKQAVYQQNNPNYSDETAASDIAYSVSLNPGSRVIATKNGKPFEWQALLNEAWGMGPKPYKGWTYDVWEDDDGDVRKKFHSAKKEGQEVDMDWSPYDTPDQKDWELWIDLGMPTREQLGLRGPMRSEDLLNLAKTKQGTHSLLTNENSVTTPKNPEHAKQMMKDLGQLQTEVPNPDPELAATMTRRKDILMKQAKDLGIDESRAHKVLDTWFKNRELQDKFAKGKLNVPSPQERQKQLKQQEPKKKVDEYGADTVSPYGQVAQKIDPKQAQKVAANLNVQKTAMNQLKQISPDINPQKAAAAATKDIATMSPQEKEELAKIGKTVSPALGTPAFGSIKTAIQKSQVK